MERDEYPGEREPGVGAYRIDAEAVQVARHGGDGPPRTAALVVSCRSTVSKRWCM
jgi:hypothetical protein